MMFPEAKKPVAREKEREAMEAALGGFTPGEKLKALKDLRSEKGFPANTPLSDIKKRFPDELNEKLKTQRSQHVDRGTMPNLALDRVAGGESFARGDNTAFAPGKITSTNRGPHAAKMADLDAKIAATETKRVEAEGSAKAFAGMAKEPLPGKDQPPTLIKSPQQALPVSAEGQAAIVEQQQFEPQRTPIVTPSVQSSLGTQNSELGTLPGLTSLDERFSALSQRLAALPMPDIATQFAGLRMPEIDPPPMPAIEQSIVQSISARDNEKLDAVLDQLKQLNANVRAGSVLTS